MSGVPPRLSDEEYVYRRVPPSWPSDKQSHPPWTYFKPNTKDTAGLSVEITSRTTAEASRTRMTPNIRYRLLSLVISDIRAESIKSASEQLIPLDVIEDPLPENPAHALIPQLNWIDYDSKVPKKKAAIRECAEKLTGLSKWVPDDVS